jgi:hypothetical protein
LIELETNTTEAQDERVELFSIDGKAYSISTKPRVNVALKYLRVAKNQGPDIATAYMLEQLLGEEGFEALTEYEDLTVEQFTQIVAIAQEALMGSLDDPKGE